MGCKLMLDNGLSGGSRGGGQGYDSMSVLVDVHIRCPGMLSSPR